MGSRTELPWLVIHITRDDSGTFHSAHKELTRSEILTLGRPKDAHARELSGREGGKRHQVSSHSLLSYRDLHALDPALEASRTPGLIPRRGCIIVALKPLRALLTADSLLVFPEEGADSDLVLITDLLSQASSTAAAASSGGTAALRSFEYVTLSALLKLVVDSHDRSLNSISGSVERIVSRRNRSSHVNDTHVEKVEVAEDAINRFISMIERMHDAVDEVLDNPIDLESLLLSLPRLIAVEPSTEGDSGEGGSGSGSGAGAPELQPLVEADEEVEDSGDSSPHPNGEDATGGARSSSRTARRTAAPSSYSSASASSGGTAPGVVTVMPPTTATQTAVAPLPVAAAPPSPSQWSVGTSSARQRSSSQSGGIGSPPLLAMLARAVSDPSLGSSAADGRRRGSLTLLDALSLPLPAALQGVSPSLNPLGMRENPAWREDIIAIEELLEWFSASNEAQLARARLLAASLKGERQRMTMALATNRNTLLLIQIGIQTATMGMAACSMISGWFGMNLDNSLCGPEGCRPDTDDYGRPAWVLIVTVTTSASLLLSVVIFYTARRIAT